MSKQIIASFLGCSFYALTFCMEEPPLNHLQAKYPAPIAWDSFETENLDGYSQGEVALFACTAICQKAPVKFLRKIFEDKELSPNIRDANGNPVLTLAILHDHLPGVMFLLNRKAKVVYETDRASFHEEHTEYPYAITPWRAACIVGQEKYLSLIHGKLSDKDKETVLRNQMRPLGKLTPMGYALKHKKTVLAAFVYTRDNYTLTIHDQEEMATWAAQWPDATYLTPLYNTYHLSLISRKNSLLATTVAAANLAGARFLISKDATPDAQMCAIAALNEDKQMLDMLCQAGVSLKAKDTPYYQLPIRECLMGPKLKSTTPINLLLNAGAQADELHGDDLTQPIHYLATKYIPLSLKKSLIELLRAKGIKLDTQDGRGNTILHRSCNHYEGHQDDHFMFYLLDCGANANIQDKNGRTPFLMFCESNRNIKKLSRYIETYHPDLNTQDNFGDTPLIYAAAQGKKAAALVALLVNYGADMHASRNRMLHKACETLNVDLAQSLLKNHGADAADKDSSTITPLMHVVTAHNFAHETYNAEKIANAKLELIDILAQNGADLDAQDSTGRTALHHATQAERPCQKILQKLLALGANATIRHNDKKTPLEISITAHSAYSQDSKIIELLLAHTKENPLILSTGQTPSEYLVSVPRRSMFDDGRWQMQLLELFARHKS